MEVSLPELKHQHLIPTFKDSEPLISHSDFIEVAAEVVGDVFKAERILTPSVRLSHPVLGRIPEAKDVPAAELQDWQKTRFYERMMFVIEVPTISDVIDGQALSLTIGGVRSYAGTHLRKGADESFKVFAGFSVKVCSNLSVWADGFAGEVRVKDLYQLEQSIRGMINGYDAIADLVNMEKLQQYHLSEHQFAQLVGRCRMYQHLSATAKKQLPELSYGDSQINSICKDYYKDSTFGRQSDGSISLFKVHNLFTAANKASYIDSFLERAVQASSFVGGMAQALEHNRHHWFLS